MKLKIETQPHGAVRVEFSGDETKRPIVKELTKEQVAMLISFLQTATRSSAFVFQMEM